MSKPNTKCRVCGKEYFCCSDSKNINSWRTMACSVECFKEYMRRIEESRKPIIEDSVVTPETATETVTEPIKRGRKKTANTENETNNIIEED